MVKIRRELERLLCIGISNVIVTAVFTLLWIRTSAAQCIFTLKKNSIFSIISLTLFLFPLLTSKPLLVLFTVSSSQWCMYDLEKYFCVYDLEKYFWGMIFSDWCLTIFLQILLSHIIWARAFVDLWEGPSLACARGARSSRYAGLLIGFCRSGFRVLDSIYQFTQTKLDFNWITVQKACKALVGCHDFSSFRAAACQVCLSWIGSMNFLIFCILLCLLILGSAFRGSLIQPFRPPAT